MGGKDEVLLQSTLWQVKVESGRVEVSWRVTSEEEFQANEELSEQLNERISSQGISSQVAARDLAEALSKRDPRKELERLWQFSYLQEEQQKTFAFPSSEPVMLSLLALFAGKPVKFSQITQRSPEKDGDAYIIRCSEVVTSLGELPAPLEVGLPQEEKELFAHISRTFGPEGLRHFLGFLIGLEEEGRKGIFKWSVNRHLERLGYSKYKGSYDVPLKKTATEVLKVLTSLWLIVTSTHGKNSGKKVVEGLKLFSVEAFRAEMFQQEILEGEFVVRASDFWYQSSFRGKKAQYTKLLAQIATENHQAHAFSLYLSSLLAVFWRINLPKAQPAKFTVRRLLEWCDLDKDQKTRRNIEKLQQELDYMRWRGYLGKWEHSGEQPAIADCQQPLEVVICLHAPTWLTEELQSIQEGQENLLSLPQTASWISKEEIAKILEKIPISEFAEKVGVTVRYCRMLKAGKKRASQKLAGQIKELFGNLL